MTISMTVERRRLRARSLLILSTALCSGLAVPAFAQGADTLPVRRIVDSNGVDLSTGSFSVVETDLTIGGPGQHGLSYERTWIYDYWRHNYLISISEVLPGHAVLALGNSGAKFTKTGGVWVNDQGNDGSTLESVAPGYKYTDRDGTVYIFDTSKVPLPSGYTWGYYFQDTANALATSIKYADGTILSLNYLVVGPTAERLQSVTSSEGYQLTYTYMSNDPNYVSSDPTTSSWATIAKVQAVNLALDYCDPMANSCSVIAQPDRSVSFSRSRDDLGLTATATDELGRTTTYRHSHIGDDSTQPTTHFFFSIKRPDTANTLLYTLDSYDQYVQSFSNGVSTWTYDSQFDPDYNNLYVDMTDPLGKHRTTWTNSDIQILFNETDEIGNTSYYGYNAGKLTSAPMPGGGTKNFGYDARGNLTSVSYVPAGGGAAKTIYSAIYPSTCTNAVICNKPTSTFDARGYVSGYATTYTYDPTHGGILTATPPAPSAGAVQPQTRYSYSPLQAYYKNSGGSIVASGAPIYKLTGVSTCQTTANCVGTADEVKTTISYGPQVVGTGNSLLPLSTTVGSGDNALAATTAISYDAAGDAVAIDGPLPGTADTTRTIYNAAREVTEVVSPDPDGAGALKNRAVTTTYNLNGQPTVVAGGTSNPDGTGFVELQRVATSYDALSRKVQDTVSAGGTSSSVVQYSYDSLDRVDCTAQRMNPNVFGSLPASACTASSTGSYGPDRITKNGYDAVGRVTSSTTAYGTTDAQTVAQTYSIDGQLLTLTDAQANTTTYEYDGFNRLAKTRYPLTTTGSGTSSTTDYEQLGYDANSNVTSRLLRGGTLTIGYTYDNLNRLTTKDLPGTEPDVTYGYDLLGRRTSAATSAQTLSFTYDALGRNLTQTGPLGTVSYQYDAAGRRTRLTWPDAYYVTYDYQVTGEVTAIKESGTTTLGTYAYDDLGRRTTLTRGNGVVTSYGYDNVSRLTTLASDLAGTAYDLTLGFSYNPASQITSTTRSNDAYSWTGAANVARNYTSNGLNQYSATTSVTFGYDARGNLTSSGSDTYTYSSENLLLTGPNSVSLTYDPLMRLYQLSNATSGGRFLYDDTNAIGLYNPTTGAMTRRYILGPGTDELLIEYSVPAAAKWWKVTDERGSVLTSLDASGNIVGGGINTYDEYGIPGAGNGGRYQYTGQIYLPELGMYYYKARLYSPTLGRFMQTDPIGYGDGMNWYNYVGSDPTNATDPSGLQDCRDCQPDDIPVNGTRIRDEFGNVLDILTGVISRDFLFGDIRERDIRQQLADAAKAGRRPQKDGKNVPCTIQQKRTYHNDIVNHTAQDFIKAGYLVAFNVSLRKVGTNGVSLRAVADYIVTVPGSRVYDIHEIKTGDARLTVNQASVYETGYLQVVGNAGLPVGLENGDVVPFVFMGARRFDGCKP